MKTRYVTGEQVDNLLILSDPFIRNGHRWYYKCKCTDCGGIIEARENLMRKGVRVCGCRRRPRYKYSPNTGLMYTQNGPLLNVAGGYVIATAYGGKQMRVHRLAWEMVNGPIPEGMQIDHINRNKRDNRLSNLRLVSPSENLMNTLSRPGSVSKHKGVFWHSREKKWFAKLTWNYQRYWLGYFKSEEEAALAYNAKCLELGITTARLNTVDTKECHLVGEHGKELPDV